MNKKIEYSAFIIVGAALLIVIELHLVKLAEIMVLILGFVSFAALLHGAFGLYNLYQQKSDDK